MSKRPETAPIEMSGKNAARVKVYEPPFAEVLRESPLELNERHLLRLRVRCPWCGLEEEHVAPRVGTHLRERCGTRGAFGYISVRGRSSVDGRTLSRRRVVQEGG